MFALVHLKQKENWRLDRATIAIYNNFFLTQQEQEGMISLSKIIVKISRAQCSDAKDLIESIRNEEGY